MRWGLGKEGGAEESTKKGRDERPGVCGGQGKEMVVIQPMLGVLREGSIITHVPRGATSGA